jgi:hypothetical protein
VEEKVLPIVIALEVAAITVVVPVGIAGIFEIEIP